MSQENTHRAAANAQQVVAAKSADRSSEPWTVRVKRQREETMLQRQRTDLPKQGIATLSQYQC
jgi:hypothetical protein